jgi:putative tricarboxylic transport membrane protein
MMELLAKKFDMCRSRGDTIVALAILISSFYFLYLTFQLPIPKQGSTLDVGPRAFPMILLMGMIVLSAVIIVQNIKAKRICELTETPHPRNFWIGVAFLFLYAYLLDIVGFVVLTPIATYLFMYAIGVRSKKILIGGTLILWLVLTVTFPMLMEVQLPRGVWIFREISYFFY